MTKFYFSIYFFLITTTLFCQSYTNYFTGNTNDLLTSPQGGVCMMGGNTEQDDAMKWFLQRANGGDILVIRASGSDGYNNYLYNQLGVTVNSVETIVFNNSSAANEAYIHQKIAQAEAIWMAGGDQWDYVSYWRNTAIDSLINDGIQNRNMVIGGTSAGMAILGSIYFSAQNGTITSATALTNPYSSSMSIDSLPFLKVPFLNHVITDSHYGERNRQGRHTTFLARIKTDWGIAAKGIACDEYTALCIDENGIATAFGEYPTYDDNVYFLQVNCENQNTLPETCTAGQALTWNLGGDAVKVYNIKGTVNGTNTFDLNTWQSGTGGTWHNWSVNNGTFSTVADSAINCNAVFTEDINEAKIQLFPNPVTADYFTLSMPNGFVDQINIINLQGQTVQIITAAYDGKIVPIHTLPNGIYFLQYQTLQGTVTVKLIVL